MQLSVIQMQAELFQWYGSEQKTGRIWTRVQQLPVSTFGTAGRPSFSLHGGETNGFVHFTLYYLLPKYGHKLRRRRKETFEQALAAIATIMRLIKAFPLTFPAAENQERHGSCINHHEVQTCKAVNVLNWVVHVPDFVPSAFVNKPVNENSGSRNKVWRALF